MAHSRFITGNGIAPVPSDTTPQSPRATRKVPFPAESYIARLAADANLADSYAITLPPDATADIDALASAALNRPPSWLRALMAIRDTAVARLGLKTSRRIRTQAGTDRIGFFPVHARSERELVLGEDDKHLDFRVSVLRRPCPGGDELVMSTVAHCNNRLGRCYLAVILPFHKLVVRASLRRAAQLR
jgi:hypothetical protein